MLKWILFDLNSFFASCEQQEDPSLRGKPVAVVPSLVNTTSVIAASYEAKKFGIKTNTLVGDAKKMCPGLILKTGNHRLYTEYHHKIVKAVNEVLPVKKVLSIDEVACELIGQERIRENAQRLAQQMKDHVRNVVGSEIKSSVGVGPNILIAKIASDMQKPDGLVIVDTDEIRSKIGPLPVECIPGVGKQTKKKFNDRGIISVSQLMDMQEQKLQQEWGSIWGLRIAKELAGNDMAWRNSAPQKSYSHEHVLPPQHRSPKNALLVLQKLVVKAAARLRDENVKTQKLSFYVKFRDGRYFENSIHFSQSDDTGFLLRQLIQLYQVAETQKPVKVGVSVGDISHGPSQLSFFDAPRADAKNKAMDEINKKFGHNTLIVASTKEVQSSAKTRISFNHIPSMDDEFDEGF